MSAANSVLGQRALEQYNEQYADMTPQEAALQARYNEIDRRIDGQIADAQRRRDYDKIKAWEARRVAERRAAADAVVLDFEKQTAKLAKQEAEREARARQPHVGRTFNF